ncbi:hypothetical protein DFH28DRAFT_938362 [Melampsora americana]|nr:hypothetical protein DFH28DRAFT_938362 [Melampsora americana]
MPTRNTISPVFVRNTVSITQSDTVSSEVHATTDISTPTAPSSPGNTDSDHDESEGSDRTAARPNKPQKYAISGIPANDIMRHRAPRAARIETPDKPCLATPVLITKSTDHTDDAGHGSLTPFKMTRGELSAKRGGFLYSISPINHDKWGCTYKASGKYGLTETYVWYDLSRTEVVGRTQEFYDWIFRKLELHTGSIRDALIAKHHRKWFDDYPNHPREEAMELAQANVYTAMMLKQFQDAIRDCKPVVGLDYKHENVSEESRLMQVSPVYILQSMGCLNPDESSWNVCEAPRHPSTLTYVHGSNFTPRELHNNRWRDLVQAFLHYINKKSGGKTIIAQLDCNIKGMISNLMCFDRESSQHLADQDEIELAFKHFAQDHQCNFICRMLKIAKKNDKHKGSVGLVRGSGK